MELVTPDVGLIFWQTVVFLIVFIILALFVWKPIVSSLKAREYRIEDSLRAAANAKKDMEQIKSDNEYLLREARIQREQILKESKSEANKIIDEARLQTLEITSKMQKEAREVIEMEKKAAENQLRRLVGLLSIEIAENILKIKLSEDKSQKKLIEKLIEDIKLN